MKGTGLLFLWGLAAVAGACRSSAGRLPAGIVDLYDDAAPGGWMEIEAERDGRVLEMEAEIPVGALPAAVRAAAERELPGGRITGAEREIVGGRRGYEVKKHKDGREYELVFSAAGELLEKEVTLSRDEAPAAVLQAAAAAMPGATFRSVERVERGKEVLYHVKYTRDGASYKLVLAPDGRVTRKVREQKAEIEIPLR